MPIWAKYNSVYDYIYTYLLYVRILTKNLPKVNELHHGGAVCQSSSMDTVFIATPSRQPLCDGLAKGADKGFYIIMYNGGNKLVNSLILF
jgi:hypothetical protein